MFANPTCVSRVPLISTSLTPYIGGEKMSRKMFAIVSLIVLASMVLTACQPQTIVQTVEVTKIVAGEVGG